MVQPLVPTHSSSPTTTCNRRRRHAALFALLLLTSPFLIQAVLGGAVPHTHQQQVSTDEALELLASPGAAPFRNYHGVVHTLTPANKMRQEIAAAGVKKKKIQPEDEDREPASRAKNRMNADIYPVKDRIPDVTSPQVQAWIKEIDWSKVPNIPVAKGLADAPHFPACPPREKVDKKSCWWSCDGCVAPSDIMSCPSKEEWGLTYDDGPSEDTRDLMKHLQGKKLSATFFIVGSRVLEYPDILKDQVAQGHHLAMHTWSHAGLTTLTNHEIVAEVKWTEKIIRDVTGLTMKYVRPPYGDCDNRVREILRQMGYSTVIWTLGWDTNDWRMLQHQIKEAEILNIFNNALDNTALIKSASGSLAGPITLEHDLSMETINLSKKIIPIAMARGLKPMSLAKCLKDANPYQTLGQHVGGGGGGAGTKDNTMIVKNGTVKGVPGSSETDSSSPSSAEQDPTLGETVGSKSGKKSDGATTMAFKTMGYAAMGLSFVASYMLSL